MIPSAAAVPNAYHQDGAGEESPLRRYIETVLRRKGFVVLAVLLCTCAAVAYVFTASAVYEAHADMLVTPVPDDQTAVLGLGLIPRASDPTRDVTTAARLIGNVEVARRVVGTLGVKQSPEALLKKISVEPVAQSSIVAITASAGSPREARRLANAFGQAAVAERTEQLYRELDPAIENMRKRIATLGGSPTDTQPLYEQLAALESLRSGPDPTLRLETLADDPTAPVWPRKKLSIAGGIFTGLLLGIAGAFVLEALDTRRQREDRLTALGLDVLANVPEKTHSPAGSHAFEESFRFLRTMIRFASPHGSIGTIAVTSALEQEGKTTTSYQLALAAVEAGQSVLLVEADPYRPGLRRILQVDDPLNWARADPRRRGGLLDYLSGDATLDDIVEGTSVPQLSFLPAGSLSAGSITGLLERERGRELVAELDKRADLVILDSPPVGPRSDAVLIASVADAVLLVVDTSRSTETDVTAAVHRLRSARSNLLGVVLNRDASPAAEYDYQALNRNGARGRRSPVKGRRSVTRTRDG